MNHKLKQKNGFTLIELMIVLMVIAIVVAVSTMSGLAARVRANEGQAQMSLKTVVAGSEMFYNSNSRYPDDIDELGPDYIADDLASGTKSGYTFELKSANVGSTFTTTAVPASLNYTGVKSYCITALNAILVYSNAPALSADGISCPSGGTPLSS